jgi:hypothetical protein
MSSFTRALLEPTGATRAGRAVFRVAEPFTFEIGRVGSGFGIIVPAGFESDLASVPWWALHLVNVGALARSAVLHDFLREQLAFSKVEGDAIFLTAMAADSVRAWQRELVFAAVRLNQSRARSI